jgi:hypothetical protein
MGSRDEWLGQPKIRNAWIRNAGGNRKTLVALRERAVSVRRNAVCRRCGRLLIGEPLTKQRALCDKAVSTVLTTTDAIELPRAMCLIRRLDCKISTRL